jgi:hypothetical protein
MARQAGKLPLYHRRPPSARPPTPLSPAATTVTSDEAHNFSIKGVLSSWHRV